MENKLEECWISAYSRWLLEDRTIITIQMLQERGISAYLKKFLHPVRDLYIFFNKYRRKLGHKFACMPLWWNRNTRAFNSGCNVANTKMPENLSTCLSTYQIPKTCSSQATSLWSVEWVLSISNLVSEGQIFFFWPTEGRAQTGERMVFYSRTSRKLWTKFRQLTSDYADIHSF